MMCRKGIVDCVGENAETVIEEEEEEKNYEGENSKLDARTNLGVLCEIDVCMLDPKRTYDSAGHGQESSEKGEGERSSSGLTCCFIDGGL